MQGRDPAFTSGLLVVAAVIQISRVNSKVIIMRSDFIKYLLIETNMRAVMYSTWKSNFGITGSRDFA